MRKNEESRTPGEKARRATLGIIARLGGCAYLAYIIYNLIKMSVDGTSDMPQAVVIATTVVLGLAALAIIVLSVRDFIRGVKNQDYSMHKYYQEELASKGLVQNEFGEFVPAESQDEGENEVSESEEAEDEEELEENVEDDEVVGEDSEESDDCID